VAGPHRNVIPVFQSAFKSPDDETDTNKGIRPVVFDILAPDQETSILPEGMRMVLHTNPQSMGINYANLVERIQTRGGYVEQHWGRGISSIDFNMVTGGFMRLYSGLSNITGGPGARDTLGTRRETIAYDKYLDMLALFHNNGSVYDNTGKIVFQGIVKITFDGGIYYGWFSNFNVTETADQPYMFSLTTSFTVDHEVQRFRTMPYTELTPQQRAQPRIAEAQELSSGPQPAGAIPQGTLPDGTEFVGPPEPFVGPPEPFVGPPAPAEETG
jgi:hypothetical protein